MGRRTKSGQYPWLVAIFELTENNFYLFRCAGNLISHKHIITAAHCATHPDRSIFPKEDLVVVLGNHNIRNWARRSILREVETIYIHPDYLEPSDADLAVLLLNRSVQYTSTLKPICIWNEADK